MMLDTAFNPSHCLIKRIPEFSWTVLCGGGLCDWSKDPTGYDPFPLFIPFFLSSLGSAHQC